MPVKAETPLKPDALALLADIVSGRSMRPAKSPARDALKRRGFIYSGPQRGAGKVKRWSPTQAGCDYLDRIEHGPR